MRGTIDDREIGAGKYQRDTELTLNATTLLGILVGLVLLCGLFFGLGFAVGRYGPSDSDGAGQAQAANAPSTAGAGYKPKPSPTAQFVSQPQRAEASVPIEASSSAAGAADPVEASSAGSYNSQPEVKQALPAPSYAAAPQSAPAVNIQPALPVGSSLMVQIAAVTHPEDAEVLLGALRKRGYAVSVRRLPTDSLMHVQLGPFSSRDEAYRWRQKLLNDGYNAIIEP